MISWDSPLWGQEGLRSESERDSEGLYARCPALAYTNVHESDTGSWVQDRHNQTSEE